MAFPGSESIQFDLEKLVLLFVSKESLNFRWKILKNLSYETYTIPYRNPNIKSHKMLFFLLFFNNCFEYVLATYLHFLSFFAGAWAGACEEGWKMCFCLQTGFQASDQPQRPTMVCIGTKIRKENSTFKP